MLTNVHFPQAGPVHRRSGNEVNLVVASYCQLSRGVDGVNHMALHMRQMGRQMTWSHAVRAFVLRYDVVNAYATCRSLGGARTGTMFDWQWDLIRRRFCTVAVAKPIHVPVRMPGRRVCAHCNRGKTHYVCCGCGKWYHVGCFAVAHGVTGVVEADVEEEGDEAEEDGSEREESEDDTDEKSEVEGEEDEEEESEEEEERDGEEDEDMEDDEDEEGEGGGGRTWWNRELHGREASAIPTHGTSANPRGQPRRMDTQTVRTRPPKSARVCNSDVLRVLRVLRVPEVCF